MSSEHWNYRETHPSTRNEGRGAAQSSPRTAQLGGDGFGAGADGAGKHTWVPRLGQGQGMGWGGEEQTNRDERGGTRDGAAEGREKERGREICTKK